MRAIGTLPDLATARAFGDYLLVQGMQNQVEADEQGRWVIWVWEDDHLERARTLLTEFQQDPQHARYRSAQPTAADLREQAQREEKQWSKRLLDRRRVWRRGNAARVWLTLALVGLCAAVAFYRRVSEDDALLRTLSISVSWEAFLPEVRAGQWWRLFTPILLHFGVLHLVFNMMWLLDLGGMIESRQGSLRLAALVVGTALLSNLAQYLVAGPRFGGMSGVIYGLFGYIWMRGRHDPASGLVMDSTNATLMVIWFFACLTGWMGPVANTAHAAGAVAGLAWGRLSAWLATRD